VGGSSVRDFLHLCKAHFSATLGACRGDDGMFESYQVLSIRGRNAHVRRLYPMLEGQVAALSTGLVDAGQSISLLDALRSGPLYRADQHSYMLYPNRDLPGFLEKNTISAADAERLSVTKRAHAEWAHMLSRDADGDWHFNASFRNARELDAAAADLPAPERSELLELFEKTFDHASFTGRSGTFFAYEGLGSIYWHMVSKLMLAVQERLIDSVLGGADESTVQGLKDRYIDVRAGLGFNKDPATYGAFPTDPYSHTPWGQGARQPGMTGQVKEEIVARFGELGLVVRAGRIRFVPELILEDQWRPAGDDFEFTFCGVPFTVARGGAVGIEVRTTDGQMSAGDGLDLTREISAAIFDRKAAIESVRVVVPTGVRDGGA
jgi:hypothetical protein